MTDEEPDYGRLLYKLFYEMHPVYGSTSGPYGGPGGQAITSWCNVNSPYSDSDFADRDEIERAVSHWYRSQQA